MAIRRLVASIEELNQRRENPIVVLILDYMDTSFLDFPGLFGSHWRCYDALGALRLGLQPPTGVPVTVWVNHIATSFCARAGLIAAWATMANEMRWLAAAMNPRPDEELVFPDFQLLLDVANELPGKVFARKTQYLESYIQCLEGITQASGDLFRTFKRVGPGARPDWSGAERSILRRQSLASLVEPVCWRLVHPALAAWKSGEKTPVQRSGSLAHYGRL